MLTGLNTTNTVRTIHEGMGGKGIAPLTLNLRTRWRRVVNLTPRPSYPQTLVPKGPVSTKNLLALLGIESWLTGRPVGSQVNIMTELPRVRRLYFKNGKLFLPVSITPPRNKVSSQINTGRIQLLLPVHCLARRSGSSANTNRVHKMNA